VADVRVRDGGSSTSRLYVLDGLRFVAALGVVLFHYTGRENPTWGRSVWEEFPDFGPIASYGGFGPYLFFMISGFVVLMSAWGRSVPAFVASRVGRLYPAYWFAVILTAGLVFTHQTLFDPVWRNVAPDGLVLQFTMFQQAFGVIPLDGVYWTLWVELKFYVLLGLMMLIGITRGRMLLLCLVWPVLGAMATQSQSQLLISVLEPNYASFFCIGILLYLIRRDGWGLCAGLLLLGNCCAALWIANTYYAGWTVGVLGAPLSRTGVTMLFLGCVAAVMVATVTPVARLRWRWLAALGALTYPLYLVHQAAGWVLIQALHPVLPKFVVLGVVIGLMLVLAHLVHRFVELPLGPRLRRAVTRDLAAPAPAAVAAPVHEPVPATHWETDGADAELTERWPIRDPARRLPRVPPVPHRVPSDRQKLDRHSRERSSAM
jgi:peptidoglycan/LPS O-acetylase OafA/YrhL